MIIAIDGPAASGKGTLAERLARHFGFAHLDTGLLYRSVALLVMHRDIDPDDAKAAASVVEALPRVDFNDPALRALAVGAVASRVAAHKPVRDALLAYQRDFASNPPDGKAGAILEGRDITTVICPDADVKIFITASPEARAQRRFLQSKTADPSLTIEQVRADIAERDTRDTGRKDAPLRQVPDAHLLETSDLTIEAAVSEAVRWVEAALVRPPGRLPDQQS